MHSACVLLLMVVGRRCAVAATNAPIEEEGAPSRLPTVLPSSVDNNELQTLAPGNEPSGRRRHHPAVNITGLIVASSLARFERAAAQVRRSDIHSTIWIPAVFLNESNYSRCGGGGNGLRHAMRNAWNLIASSNVGMAVFEEDVAYAADGQNASVSHYIASACLRHGSHCDLAYLGEWNGFFTTHAIYIPPQTAVALLEMTAICFPWRVQIDQAMHARCLHRPGRVPWACIRPPAYRLRGTFGQGFFVQDPVAVPPFLHAHGTNKAISR